MVMSKRNQMIGRRGEKLFSTLCSDAEVTCNKSDEDDYGWDFLIQFPARSRPLVAIDQQPGPVAALVQVKTTEGDGRSASISLANALRYAESPLPIFIILIVLGENGPQYFAKHVWTPMIGAWLKLGREADAAGRYDTHKQIVSIAFDQNDHRSDLLDWIEREIAVVSSPYAAAKKVIFDTIGFDRGQGSASVSFRAANHRDFIDVQLGLRSHIDVSRFVFTSERFGISAGRPEIDERNVRLEMVPEGRAAQLRSTFSDGGSIVVPAKFYSAKHGSSQACRVATRCFNIIYDIDGSTRAHAKVEPTECVSVEDLILFAGLQAARPGETIALEFEMNDISVDLGSIEMTGGNGSSNWPWLSLSLHVLRQVASAASRPVPGMRLADLHSSAGELEILCALASDRLIRLDFSPNAETPTQFHAMLAWSLAKIGDHVFAAVARRSIIDDRTTKGRRRMGFGTARLLAGFVVEARRWSDDQLVRAYERQLDLMSVTGDIMALGDMRVIAAQGPGDKVLKSDLPRNGDRRSQGAGGSGRR